MALARRHWISLLFGVLLFACTWGLHRTAPSLSIAFIPDWTNSTPGEIYFWLACLVFLTPAGWLLGFGVYPRVAQGLRSAWARVENLSSQEKTAGVAVLMILHFGMARAAHFLMLRGYPITDDEWATRLGGQVLAMGRAMAPLPEAWRAMPDFYLFVRDGYYTSFDWVGCQAAWAFAHVTGTGTIVFSVLAAIPTGAIAYVLGKRLGPAWAVVGASLFILSPMGFAFSATSHGQLISRAGVALVLALYVRATETRTGWPWAALGLVLGVSVVSRPFETLFMLAPLALGILWDARRDADARRAIGWVALGMVPPICIWMTHQYFVAGHPLLPARWATSDMPNVGGTNKAARPVIATFTSLDVFWSRFGRNFAYNALMLIIWATGAVGAALAAVGALRDRFAMTLGVCILAALVLTLFHDNPGIHTAGPMHYQEALVPITLLTVMGLERSVQFLRTHGIPSEALGAAVLGGFLVSFLSFDVWHGLHLRRQAAIHEFTYGLIENEPKLQGAVVMAPRYSQLWARSGLARQVGSFVFSWRPVSPTKDERVVIVHDVPEAVEALRRDYPERPIWRLTFPTPESPPAFVPLAPPLRPEDADHAGSL